MKKFTKLLIVLIFIAGSTIAQVPTYFNTNAVGGANAFPLNNSATSRKVQWFIPPNSLGGFTAQGNNITDVYFQAGSTATRLYPTLTVKLKQGTGTGLTGAAAGPVEAGMTVVYTGANVTIASTANGWIKITLQTPWLYNPSFPLIVELEHNSTSGTGPTILQAVSIPGPGNGRQWADFNVGTITGVGTNQVNFGIDVLPAVPCSGAPASNSPALLSFTTCPGATNPTVGLAYTYTFGGMAYQWYSSTISPVGPFSAINNATASAVPIPTLASTTWFQAVATCTNGGGASTTLTPSQFFVAGVTTNTAPYFEGFENLLVSDRLPNCSWLANGLGTVVTTYTSSQSQNRTPRTGNKFAAFSNAVPGVNYAYTNGIYMVPGITYSASVWYQTDLTGADNWTDFSLLVGSAQTPSALTSIASSSGAAISLVYKPISGTFTVGTPGFYNVAVRATSIPGTAVYLSWDDLAVEIPCSPGINTPSVTLSASTSSSICDGTPVNLTASGANSYTWSTGSTASAITATPNSNQPYYVTGMNAITGCLATTTIGFNVKPSPIVSIINLPATGCAGKTMTLIATGALNYVWNTGAVGSVVSVAPNASTTYTVIGTNSQGCSAQSTQFVTIFPNPSVAANANRTSICVGESEQLNGSGALSYKWTANTIYIVANPVTVSPLVSTSYTVTGTDANGCSSTDILNMTVNSCTGLKANNFSNEFLLVYPNPNNGEFIIELMSSTVNTIQITDISGKVIASYKNVTEVLPVNISTFNSGIYFVEVKSERGNSVVKIIKE